MENVGVIRDVSAILGGSYKRPRLRGLSGFLPDGMISHHTDYCQDTAMFAYGFEWLSDPLKYARVVANTPYGFTQDQLEVPAKWIAYSYARVVFKGGIDIAISGREYHAETTGLFWNIEGSKAAKMLVEDHEESLPESLVSTLRAMYADDVYGPNTSFGYGNTAFFNSDTMIHRRANTAGENWYISVRFRSTRAQGAEDFEDEPKSWHMGSGMLQTKVVGDEYDYVRARMDWHVIPNVTEEWRTDSLPDQSDGRCGINTLAGSVSDGDLGAAFYHHLPDTSLERYNVVEAQKSWYFGPSGVVASGRKIKRVHTYGSNEEIVTTLEQSRWRSAITVHVEGSSSIQLPFDADGGCARTITIPRGKTAFLHQGKVGYVIKAEESNLDLELRCGTSEVEATDSDTARDNRWGDRTSPENRDRWDRDAGDWYKSDRPFLAVLHHGNNPTDGSYLYATLPSIESTAASRAFNFFTDEVRVFHNDESSAQAITWLASSTDDVKLTSQMVFWTGGSSSAVSVLLVPGEQEVSISSEQPAIVQTSRISLDRWRITATQGNADPSVKNLTLSFSSDTLFAPGEYNYMLPGIEPRAAVDTVTVNVGVGVTTIVFGLPDEADDEEYGFQGEFYAGPPISVLVPAFGSPPLAPPPSYSPETPDDTSSSDDTSSFILFSGTSPPSSFLELIRWIVLATVLLAFLE